MKTPAAPETPAPKTEEPGLPFLHSWKAVYIFVLATFGLWVALLIALTSLFS
jgi:hypothetical protein